MIQDLRASFNQHFSIDKYEQLNALITNGFDCAATFRISETPIFIPEDLRSQLEEACDMLNNFILSPNMVKHSDEALKRMGFEVPNQQKESNFIQYDFGITKDESGRLVPKLIEMQGFPSLYLFQWLLAKSYKTAYSLPEHLHSYFNGFDDNSYIEHLKQLIIGDSKPEHVVLLEIEPEKQNTRIDFEGSAKVLGIKVLDLKDLLKSGKSLYYISDGKKIDVERIYNRVIFDELNRRSDIKTSFSFHDEIDAEWVGHPNWFYRISKYTMPFIHDNPYIPKTKFLSEFTTIPQDLENFVLKPLFSFSGEGVKFNVTRADIDDVKDPENWVLQEKIQYFPVINTIDPKQSVKCEIRMMHTWLPGAQRPQLINNLVRMSKGEMIGVKYNKDKDWVGASVGLMENF